MKVEICNKKSDTPPKLHSEFTPENWVVGKLLSIWGPVTFQGKLAVELQGGRFYCVGVGRPWFHQVRQFGLNVCYRIRKGAGVEGEGVP